MSKCKSKICNPPQNNDRAKASPEIIAATEELNLSNDQLKKAKAALLDCIQKGLNKDTHNEASVKCFLTYVQDLPDGTQNGKYLALDLGGSNFRVLLVTLDGTNYQQEFQIYSIDPEIMTGPGEQLFDFIAECLSDFVNSHGVAEEELPLGFTFSFPLVQKGLKSGVLDHWSKGFTCEGVVGEDVVLLLNAAIERRGDVKISVCAVLNDTTGTLMSCAFNNPQTRIGLIIGTGTNACYVEKQANAELFDEPDRGSGNVIINLEWGGFGDQGELDFCRTEYDKTVDENAPNPGWRHEKMISGMYMGELVRLAAVRFTNEGLMFGSTVSDALNTVGSFETKFVSDIEAEPIGTYTKIKEICDGLGLTNATDQDYENLRYICESFSRRAAFLVSAGLATLIEKIGEPLCVVGVDGTLFKSHPTFKTLMVTKIGELVEDKNLKFELQLSEDGSGRGAAIVAAVASTVDE